MNEPELSSATDSASLEHGYRRLLACYPRAFRRENEEEILAVLLACAQDGQTRPSLEASVDLLKGAARMRLRPRPGQPRTVFAAVRLMWAGAAAELAALITIIVTAGAVRSAVLHAHPAAGHALLAHLIGDVAGAPIAIGLWLFLAWANSKGRDAARLASAASFCLLTLSLLGALAQGAVAYAPADMIAAAVLWFVALGAVVLIFVPASSRYYRAPEAVLI
jgi:hypothetical protein